MKNYNIALICLCLIFFSFPLKNQEEKLILEKEEEAEYLNLRNLDKEEGNSTIHPPEYHKSSGGLSGGAVAGIVVAAVVVVVVAVVLAIVLKGVVLAATAVGVTTTSALTAGAGAGGASAAGGFTGQSASGTVFRY